jgi:hypothetical protein
MADIGGIRERIEVRISQGEFLGGLLQLAGRKSAEVQQDFVGKLSGIAAAVRAILEENGFIEAIPYRPQEYWPAQRGKTYAFIDGGVANVELPTAAPIGIRVGSYVVRPGDETDDREKFNIELALVDDLFSDEGFTYDADFDDVAKLRDAARIVSETAAAYGMAKEGKPPDLILLQGPLVNPASPYGLDRFPSFGLEASRTFLRDEAWSGDQKQRQFVPLYLELLGRLRGTGTPVAGAVERSVGRDPVVLKSILNDLQDRKLLPREDVDELVGSLTTYGLNDASILDVVLRPGEYVRPMPITRQGPENKWPNEWKQWIRDYPNPLTTYLKPSELTMPFRVEAFDNVKGFVDVLALILHTSRLLPSYGFPVGLDIVDKYAKVPAWMSRSVKGQYQVVLLQKALASGDAAAISFAKRVLAAKGRDWLFRPTA